MILTMSKSEYLIFREFIDMVFQFPKIVSVVIDENLVKLGFVEEPPCIVDVTLSDEDIEKIIDICDDLEIDAYNNEPEIPSWYDPMVHSDYKFNKTEAELKFERYGWIANIFYDS